MKAMIRTFVIIDTSEVEGRGHFDSVESSLVALERTNDERSLAVSPGFRRLLGDDWRSEIGHRSQRQKARNVTIQVMCWDRGRPARHERKARKDQRKRLRA
jgi:hypothetical protein